MDFTKRTTTSGPGLLIGIPTLGRPVPLSWATAWKSMNPPINISSNVLTVYDKPVDQARNDIAQKALELDSKYLFFLGDDVVCPPNILKQFILWMENHPEIGVLTGVYCSKSDPPAPLVFRGNGKGSYWDWHAGEFFEITGCGMDACMIRVDLFKKLSKPWFKTIDTDQFAEGINHADQWTEDLYFCKKVIEETEYKIYCDASILCEHHDVYSGKVYTLPHGSNPTLKKDTQGKKRAVDIGCGAVDRTTDFPDYDLTRVDISEVCKPDYRCDVRNMPFANNSFDLVFSSHVLEHFDRNSTKDVLGEWLRVLKPDGELILVLPDIEWAFKNIEKQEKDAVNVLYGGQTSNYDYHYNGFWQDKLEKLLAEFGMKIESFERKYYNMIVRSKRG